MHTTSPSLLERLRQPEQKEAWDRFVQLYSPLIYYWARRTGMQSQDASDLVQDVFTLLLRKLPEFEYDGTKSFRGWLRTVTLNKWKEKRRRQTSATASEEAMAQVTTADHAGALWEREYHQYLVGRALDIMKSQFQPSTWQACWKHAVEGKPAAEVAAALHISVNAVYLATSRVLQRLRTELNGLMD